VRSAFEEEVIGRLRGEGGPEPRINEHVAVRRGTLEVDLHWPDLRIVVEIDGAPHRRHASIRRDRNRARRLRAAGWLVERIRYDSLDADIQRVMARLTNVRE
jgi:very-short-patch-repair endonuclease